MVLRPRNANLSLGQIAFIQLLALMRNQRMATYRLGIRTLLACPGRNAEPGSPAWIRIPRLAAVALTISRP